MPITLPDTPVGTPIGPGFIVRVVTDLPGPLPPDAHWRLILTDVEGTAIACVGERTTTLKDVGIVLGFDADTGNHRLNPVTSTLVEGLDARLRVELTGTSTLLEFLEQTQKFDWTTGAQYVNASLPSTSTPVGGFDETDRQRLEVVEQSVTLPLPPQFVASGVGFVLSLANVLKSPEPNQLCAVEPRDLTQYTVLQRPAGIFPVAALGCLLQFSSIPDKLGLTLGANNEYAEHIAQVNVVYRDACGLEYSRSTHNVHRNNEKIVWGAPAPERLEVWILPGCVVTFSWLLYNV